MVLVIVWIWCYSVIIVVMDSNQTLRENEMSALSAIYGDDWRPISVENGLYSMTLRACGGSDNTITLDLELPAEYPLSRAPILTLSAPWMARKAKKRLMDELDEIYERSGGDSIIYSWIEKAREYLDQAGTVDEPEGVDEGKQRGFKF